MGTRKSVDKILDDAANILEKRGFTTSMCFDPETGGFCALGAIARAVYPRATDDDIDDLAYSFDQHAVVGYKFDFDPKYNAAVLVAAATIRRRKTHERDVQAAAVVVYDYNDKRGVRQALVVKMLRRAAERARKEAAPA